MLSAADFGVAVFRVSGDCLLANETFSRHVCVSRNELLNKNILQNSSGFLSTILINVAETVTENNDTSNLNQLATRSSEIDKFDFYYTILKDVNEWYILLISIDANNHVVERELRVPNEQQYKQLFELARDAIFVADAETGIIVECNRQAELLLDRPQNEIIGMHQTQLHPPEMLTYFMSVFKGHIATKGKDPIEGIALNRNGKYIPVEINSSLVALADGRAGIQGIFRDITERKLAEEQHQAHLHYFECMDKVNKAIQGALSLDLMLSDVLEVVLSIFNCDRAWLLYPCDPEAASFHVPMERTRPGYPGAMAIGADVPVTPEVVLVFQTMLDSSGPTQIVPADVAQQFNYRSQIMMAIYPKISKPWVFGLHQCSYARVWTPEEERLFQEIGRRLSDGLTNLLMLRNVQESEDQLKEAQSIGLIGSWVFEIDSQKISWSDETFRLYDRDPVLGVPSLEEEAAYYSPEQAEVLREYARRAIEEGTESSYDLHATLPSGKQVSFLARVRPIRDAHGRVSKLSGIVQDMTERKQAEQVLQKTSEMLRAIIEAAPTAIIGLDLDGCVHSVWNPAAEKMLGWSALEATGHPLPSVPQDNLEEFQRFRERIRNGLTLDGVDVRRQRRDGSPIDYSIYASPLHDADGRITGNVAVLVDISERKQAEEKLRESAEQLGALNEELSSTNEELTSANEELTATYEEMEAQYEELVAAEDELKESQERYRTVADFTYDWEYWLDPDGRLLYCSPSCERITGYRIDEFIEDPNLLAKITRPDDRHLFEQHLCHALGDDISVAAELEFRIVTRNGDERWIAHVCQPVLTTDGAYRGRRASNKDITARKQAEAEIIRANRALQMLSGCNEALIHFTDEAALLNEVCRIAVELGGYRMAWVGFVEHDPEKTLRPVAHAGIDSGYIASAKISWADTERGRGPGGTAIRTRKPCIVRSVADESDFAPWREAALLRGYQSVAVFPLKDERQTLGAIAFYSVEKNVFNAKELAILDEMASDLAFGIVALRTRAAQQRSADLQNARLRLSEFSREHTLDELLTRTLDECEHLTGSKIGFFHFVEADQQTLWLQAWSTNTVATMCTAEGRGNHYSIADAGVWVDCAKLRRPVIHNDYAGLPHKKGMPSGHAVVIRELAVPVIRGDKVVAILGVGNKPEDYNDTDAESISLLASLAWDIVVGRRAEISVIESEEKYRKLVELAQEGVWVVDENDVTSFVNPQMAKMLGYTSSEIVGHDMKEFIVPAEYNTQMEVMEARRRGYSTSYERHFIRKDGSDLWCQVSGTPLVDDNGQFIGSFGMFTDIRDRKRAEYELQIEKDNLNAIFASSPVGMLLLDQELAIAGANSVITNFVLKEPAHVIGQQIGGGLTCVHSLESDKGCGFSDACAACPLRNEILKVLSSGTSFHAKEIQLTLISKGQEQSLWLSVSAEPVMLNGRKHVIVAVDDISERKRAEAERAAFEEHLWQSQKMEAIGTLAGGIAHDFNNMLFAILANGELVCDSLAPGSLEYDNMRALITAANRATDLVRQILTFSRKTQVEQVPLNLVLYVKGIAKLLRATLPSTIELKLNLEPVNSVVMADPTAIHQVLLNLCTNASHALGDTKGMLQIGLREIVLGSDMPTPLQIRLTPGLYNQLTVMDTGTGMPPEVQARVFEPFFTTKPQGKGTGMGLSVVHGIITRLGGEIQIESTVGIGSRIIVLLPAIPGQSIGESEVKAVLPRGNSQILVVDDESAILDAMRQMLTGLGYFVTCCQSAYEALALLTQNPHKYSILLTDQTMPYMTGIDLIKEMRKLQPELPVILCTGYSESITEDTVKNLYNTEFLLKPISRPDLAAILLRVLNDRDTPVA